jgi:predicted permease
MAAVSAAPQPNKGANPPTMLTVALAVLPVFLLIFLGSFLFRKGLFDAPFWQGVERLTYFVLFPALLVGTLAKGDLALGEVLPMVVAIDGAILVMAPFALLLKRALGMSGPQFGAFLQGVVRMNTYIGLAVSFAIYGQEGLAKAAIAVVAIVPLVNVLSVTTLLRYGEREGGRKPNLLRELARNPLILACIVGFLLNLSGIGMPPVVGPMLDILGRAALALGLLAVGAALDLQAARRGGGLLIASALLKLVAMPLMTAVGCWVMEVEGTALGVALLFNGLPTATTAYILARQLGGDHRLMAAMITGQTALSMITIPVILGWLG